MDVRVLHYAMNVYFREDKQRALKIKHTAYKITGNAYVYAYNISVTICKATTIFFTILKVQKFSPEISGFNFWS